MHTIYIIALLLAIIGLLGSILPVLPGVIFSLAAMLIVEFGTSADFSTTIWYLAIILISIAIISDYVLPIMGAKYGGGSKAGTRGSIIGMIVGIFFLPRGLIVGPLLGAWIGEWYVKQDSKHAFRAAWYSFLGSVGSMVLKLIAGGMVLYWVILAWMGS